MSTFQMRVFLIFLDCVCLPENFRGLFDGWAWHGYPPSFLFVKVEWLYIFYRLGVWTSQQTVCPLPSSTIEKQLASMWIYCGEKRSLLIKSVQQWWLTLHFLVFPVTCRWVNHRHFAFFSYCFGNNSARRQFLMKIFCKHHHKSQTGIECVKCNYIYIGRAELLLTWFLWLVLMAYEDVGGSFE